jgi:pyruvate dehydrogenase E1 component alpha subunit
MHLPAPDALETLRQLYRCMSRIRAFEDAAEIVSQGGVSAYNKTADGSAKVRGPLHLSTGQEAVPAGVCAHLKPADLLTSTHRGHGHTLAKGADLAGMMCELYGKASGFNGGKGGSMHIADFSVGMLGANGVVAAGLPIAVGAAHAQKLQGSDAITVCFFGDGAINRGPFLEALNWASIHRLPVLFVCEDNRWSATTASAPMIAGDGASARSASLGIAAHPVNGNEAWQVHALAGELIGQIRAGSGPRLLHAITYRLKGHVSVDPAAYRDPKEVQQAQRLDPLLLAQAHYQQLGGQPADLQQIDAAAAAEVAQAMAVADAAPWPEASAAYTDIQSTGEGQWF